MRIAIIGTGGVALATAALIHEKGHALILVSLTGNGGKALAQGTITATGAIDTSFQVTLALSLEAAMSDADHVIVATSADRYQSVLSALRPHVEKRHRTLISGELSLFGSVLRKSFEQKGQAPGITSLASTLVTGRRGDGASVHVGLIRPKVLACGAAAANPAAEVNHWNSILGIPLEECSSYMRLLLSNLNPIVHVPNALCNFTRIENGEAWSNYGGITSSVARLLVTLDDERIAIGRALGEELVSFSAHFAQANHFDAQTPLGEMAQALCARRGGLPKGPTDPSTRYVTEDVPFGLVVWERLGAIRQVETPVTSSLISVFSALYGRDFRSDNPFIEQIRLP